jgi:lycopene cyclase domain-containing protein
VKGLGYTVPAAAAVLAVCGWELLFLRTGLFRRPAYWLSMLIVLAFQIPVDGWLTKLSAPVVEYSARQITGLRGPWDIPVEDFLFGFALVTAALLLWERQGSRANRGPQHPRRHHAGQDLSARGAAPGQRPANGGRDGITVTAHSARLRREKVPAAFDAGAFAYDRLVGVNPGYHDHLRLSARRLRLPDAGRGLRLLDAGCGTGASTAALLVSAPQAEITAIDASGEMLAQAQAQARAKPWPASVTFVHTPVEELAAAGVRGPFDAVLAAYLIRNVPDPDTVLRDLYGLLRPGGTLAVHEYSVRDSLRARAVWQAVSLGVIIPAGQLAAGDASLYRYLRRSVDGFDGVARFRRRLRTAGFTGVHSETVPGWQRGIVHTFLASRSPRAAG